VIQTKQIKQIKRPWWYRTFRAMHYYAFRHWAAFLLGFFALLALWFWLCYLPFCASNAQCCLIDEYKMKVRSAASALEECCDCETLNSIDDNEIDELRREYGGSIGEVTVTLIWQTIDDLDLHLLEPSGEEIYFEHKVSSGGGKLDIDKNADDALVVNPIENIFYSSNPPSGKYRVFVHFYGSKSGEAAVPYRVYITIGGQQKQLSGTHFNEGDMHAIHEFIIP